MLIIKNDGNKSIERMLKEYKRKFMKTKVAPELRVREQFTKPSMKNRKQKQLAIYKQKLNDDGEL